MKYIFPAMIFINLFTNIHAQQIRLQGAAGEMIAGPVSVTDHDKWLDSIKQWRITEKQKLNYNDSEYNRPQLKWIKTTYMYAQVMAHDRYLYNVETGKYTVGRFVNDVTKRYGGIDAVLIWPTYPNIGVDNRNQFDLVNDMPGGKTGIKQMINNFHKHGIRVFFPIMIWDKGTRPVTDAMPIALITRNERIRC